MADRELGFIELTAKSRIIFAVGSWKGQSRGSIRKFLATEKYSGPTKSGMSLDGPTILELLTALRALQCTIPTQNTDQCVSIGKSREWEIRIAILPPEDGVSLPAVDIREFVDSSRYAGPTKKGVRFPWNKLKQFTQLVEVLVQQLGVADASDHGLFPGMQPRWVAEAKGATASATDHKPAPQGFDTASLKMFPDEFLPNGEIDADTVTLPAARLKIGQDRDGHYFVTDESDFRHSVRNEVEGKFFLYAQQRGCTDLNVPKAMFKLFSAVASYEKYSRELRQKLIRDLEARSGNRALAEHMSRETFQTHGLPFC